MASSFRAVGAAKLGTVGEHVYLWDTLLYPVALESLCEAVGWCSLACGSNGKDSCFIIVLPSQYNELDCEKTNYREGCLTSYGKLMVTSPGYSAVKSEK